MKCPRCNSTNLTRSHRRGSEGMLRFLYPREPYRCKDCNERFWKFINPLKNLAFLVFLLILFIGVVLPISWILLLGPKTRDNNTPVKRIDRTLAAANPERHPVKHPISPPPEVVTTTTIPETPPFQNTSGVETPPVFGSPLSTEHIGAPSTSAAVDNSAESPPQAGPPVPAKVTEPPPQSPAPPAPVEESAPSPQTQAPPPATASTDVTAAPLTDFRLRRIRTEQTPDAFRILANGGGRISEYRTLFLDQSPPKWVVDLPGEWQYNGPLKIEPPAGPVQSIRLGRHPDKLRIVLDLAVRSKLNLDIAQTRTGLAMILETL